jgi:dipeptidyl aminopeptidase/acylaminoacyl peptidase
MRFIYGIVIAGVIVGGAFAWMHWQGKDTIISPIISKIERPLDAYTLTALRNRAYTASPIVLDEPIATTSAYTTYTFHFKSDGKRVSGLAHIPQGSGPFPVIVQMRGYVDHEKYTPGEGTAHSGEVFASRGFLTLAPDFLGYGSSDNPSTDVFEERFETYTTAVNLLASVGTLPQADASRVGVWGHSNGGQITLTALEITGKPYPTVLWAPVSKPFPYSILYYTDDADDHGKLLRHELARFESLYDAEQYSLTNYLDWITAPLIIHQGGADTAVPIAWSDTLAASLKKLGKDAVYRTYPTSDHNMMPAWNGIVEEDVAFFRSHLSR